MICSGSKNCVRGTAQTAVLPPVLTLDVSQRLVRGAVAGRTIMIASVSRAGGRLLLQGEEVGMNGIRLMRRLGRSTTLLAPAASHL